MADITFRHPAFLECIAARRAEVDAALDLWLPRAPECPAVVASAMRYALQTGGKRFRPLLSLASAHAVVMAAGGDRDVVARALSMAMPLACAVELVHTQSLVHDDLPAMDNDVLRRGQPTVHVQYGEGLAVLVGDALLTEAFSLLAREPKESAAPDMTSRKLRVIAELGVAVGATGMVAGQAIDLAHASGPPARTRCEPLGLDGVKEMHLRKTGGLIRVAAVGGAIMAGASSEQVDALGQFASNIGIAFQIVDDILDVEGASADTGKSCGKDAAASKPTYPAVIGVQRSRVLAAEHIAEAQQALAGVGLPDDHLNDLAHWVLTRRC